RSGVVPQPPDLSEWRIAEPRYPAVSFRTVAGSLSFPLQFGKCDAPSQAVRAGRSPGAYFQEARNRYAVATRISDHDRGGTGYGGNAARAFVRTRCGPRAPRPAHR